MVIPKFYQFYPLIMQCLSNGKAQPTKEIYEFCAVAANLDEKARRIIVPSGKMPLYTDRIHWALMYLRKATLIERPKRGIYQLTENGKKAVKDGCEKIDKEYLNRFPEFIMFKSKAKGKIDENISQENPPVEISQDIKDPQEQIDEAIEQINSSLADDLMAEIMKMPWYSFERLIVILLEKIGYGSSLNPMTGATKKTNDEGIDGIVAADIFGFDSVYMQAKQWKPDMTVGRPVVQSFLGALAGQGATKGLFITTAKFSHGAIEFAKKQLQQKIVLIDGDALTKLMIKFNLGVSVAQTYEIKKIDFDFFEDDAL